jgi:hypothetical protein
MQPLIGAGGFFLAMTGVLFLLLCFLLVTRCGFVRNLLPIVIGIPLCGNGKRREGKYTQQSACNAAFKLVQMASFLAMTGVLFFGPAICC